MAQRFREIASGLGFPEGPIAMPDGDVILVEIAAKALTRISRDGRRSVIANVGGGPNGSAIGPDGHVYISNNGGLEFGRWDHYGVNAPVGLAKDYSSGSIQRANLSTGKVETLYDRVDEKPLGAPNDIVFDKHGGFWFTDHRDRGVFYAKADGSHIERVIFPVEGPNGVGLSPDGKTLFVAETFTCQLWAFEVAGPGRVNPRPSFFGQGGQFVYRPAGFKLFDSLAIEASGNICVATIGDQPGISVVSPGGELVQYVSTEDLFTTNICFGGGDMKKAYITLSGTGRLVETDWERPGLRLNCSEL
jgi:gluconolactonase